MRGKSVLLLPVDMIQAFFRPAISKCIAHVKELLQASRTESKSEHIEPILNTKWKYMMLEVYDASIKMEVYDTGRLSLCFSGFFWECLVCLLRRSAS